MEGLVAFGRRALGAAQFEKVVVNFSGDSIYLRVLRFSNSQRSVNVALE